MWATLRAKPSLLSLVAAGEADFCIGATSSRVGSSSVRLQRHFGATYAESQACPHVKLT